MITLQIVRAIKPQDETVAAKAQIEARKPNIEGEKMSETVSVAAIRKCMFKWQAH